MKKIFSVSLQLSSSHWWKSMWTMATSMQALYFVFHYRLVCLNLPVKIDLFVVLHRPALLLLYIFGFLFTSFVAAANNCNNVLYESHSRATHYIAKQRKPSQSHWFCLQFFCLFIYLRFFFFFIGFAFRLIFSLRTIVFRWSHTERLQIDFRQHVPAKLRQSTLCPPKKTMVYCIQDDLHQMQLIAKRLFEMIIDQQKTSWFILHYIKMTIFVSRYQQNQN